MALFEKEHYGKPISEQLSDYLRTYTDKHDRANVSVDTGVGTSTIREVMYRTNPVTKRNSKAIIEMTRIAIKNCERNIVKSKEAKNELHTLLGS